MRKTDNDKLVSAQRAAEMGSTAHSHPEGPRLKRDLRRVRPRPRPGRRGRGGWFPRPPPEGSRGARRRPAGPRVWLSGAAPSFGPGLERRACVCLGGGDWGGGPQGRAGRPRSGRRAPDLRRAGQGRVQGPSRAASHPPAYSAWSPGLVSSCPGQAPGPGPVPGSARFGDLATACLGPRGPARRPRSWVGGGAGRGGAAGARGAQSERGGRRRRPTAGGAGASAPGESTAPCLPSACGRARGREPRGRRHLPT